jgi:hypothetical protein
MQIYFEVELSSYLGYSLMLCGESLCNLYHRVQYLRHLHSASRRCLVGGGHASKEGYPRTNTCGFGQRTSKKGSYSEINCVFVIWSILRSMPSNDPIKVLLLHGRIHRAGYEIPQSKYQRRYRSTVMAKSKTSFKQIRSLRSSQEGRGFLAAYNIQESHHRTFDRWK